MGGWLEVLRATRSAAGPVIPVVPRATPVPAMAGSRGCAVPMPATLLDALAWHVHAHAGSHLHPFAPYHRGRVLVSGDNLRRSGRWGIGGGRRAPSGVGSTRVSPWRSCCRPAASSSWRSWAFSDAGGVPVPIYPPARPPGSRSICAARQPSWQRRAPRVVTNPEAPRCAAAARSGRTCGRRPPSRTCTAGGPSPRAAGRHRMALLQYTSGSTGDPKA